MLKTKQNEEMSMFARDGSMCVDVFLNNIH